MRIEFHKYHGNGNDFILFDNRKGRLDGLSKRLIASLCNRRFGIGADGLILLNRSKEYDFEMKYYNSDGRESTMCGNGGRCIIKFAHEIGLIGNRTRFLAIDGVHEGVMEKNGIVKLKMGDVSSWKMRGKDYIINTGSPHYVKFIKNVDGLNVKDAGRRIRNSREFARQGINVNFIEASKNRLKVRTYERGVEDETLSCGTGVVASALVSSLKNGKQHLTREVHLDTPGGFFTVTFDKTSSGFSDIWLIGKAVFVFKGEIDPGGFSEKIQRFRHPKN